MSVQKILSEADKLLEKGKLPEAIAKIKSALQLEPLNQLVATKLANSLIQNREPLEAAKVYGGLAKRLSDAGKNQVSIAIYKQALDLAPEDIGLRTRFAQECESVGKLGDAYLQGQIALNYYLRRKKYFDASNLMPLMARAQPKDEKIKIAWIEILQLCQAEQKLVHLLVALCGPPGITSSEFQVGGDPATLTVQMYEGLKKLVPFFPRDPKIAYALAWTAYRRGKMREFYSFLRECYRRDPDFCLAILLFARVLSEDKKLNEAMFIYRLYRERMTADKSVDMLTLNRLMESFIEKNGWIKFIEDSGDLLDAGGFVKSMTGIEHKETPEEKKEAEAAAVTAQEELKAAGGMDLPPAEIELGGSPASNETYELITATGQSIAEVSRIQKAGGANLTDPMRMQAELIKATIEAAVAGMGGNTNPNQAQTLVQPVILPAIQASAAQAAQAAVAQTAAQNTQSTENFTSVVSVNSEEMSELKAEPAAPKKPEPETKHEEREDTGTGTGLNFKGESVEFTSLVKMGDNELQELRAAETPPADPMATQVAIATGTPDKTSVAVSTEPASDQTIVQPLEDLVPAASAAAEPSAIEGEELEVSDESEEEAPKKKLFNPLDQAMLEDTGGASLKLEDSSDERTQIFSPIDVLGAAKVMQNRELADVKTRSIDVNKPQENLGEASLEVADEEVHEGDKTKWRQLVAEGDKTKEFSPVEAVQAGVNSRRPHDSTVPPPPVPVAPPPSTEPDFTEGEATRIVARPKSEEPAPAAASPADATVATNKVPIPDGTPEATASREISVAAPPPEPVVEAPPPPPPVAPEAAAAAEGAFMPIPAAAAGAEGKPGAGQDKIDLGDDLLDGPTRILTRPTIADKTEHLIKEIKQDLKSKVSARLNIDLMMKKADRYTAKRNYYLARKALRHAQALGADEETVKAKLRDIRKLELPEGLYNTISSDQVEKKVDTNEVLERLEREFDLSQQENSSQGELGDLVDTRIEAILKEHDPRTILDFGVGLHEMGLFKQAEALFIRLVEEFPDHAFDAYYLAAISKLSRRDFAGAASILSRLSGDAAKTDLEKIQIYYALGETFEKMRQTDRSKKFFRKVAELDANYRNIRHKLDE